MSLFHGLSIGGSAIAANQLALQLTGNNIANASTPGYAREEIRLEPILGRPYGALQLGAGVRIASITSATDRFLAERARYSAGQAAGAAARSSLLGRAEVALNALTERDLPSALARFSEAINDVVNQPDNLSLRKLVMDRGRQLTDTVRGIRQQIDDFRADADDEVVQSVDRVNELLKQVQKLNRDIVTAEVGTGDSSAGSLRTQRQIALDRLSDLIDVRVAEQASGAVQITSGSEILVVDAIVHEIDAESVLESGQLIHRLITRESRVPLSLAGGRLGGLQQARDEDFPALLQDVDAFVSTLANEFNRIHSLGQGLKGFTDVTSANHVNDPTLALDSPGLGLAFPPNHGSLEIRYKAAGASDADTSFVTINLNGTATGDSLNSVVAKINSAVGTTIAQVTSDGELRFVTPAGAEIRFQNDTSGILSAMGINTFFTGSAAGNLAVNPELIAHPELLGVSRTGFPGDSQNAANLSQFADTAIDRLGGATPNSLLSTLTADFSERRQSSQAAEETLRSVSNSLKAELAGQQGVSIDEETIKLITYQRGLQAASRYIATVNQLLDEVMKIVG